LFILLNAVVAQLTLLCVWGTLVEGTFWIRLPWTVLLLVISWGAIALGIRVDNGRPCLPEEFLAPGMVWMFGFIASYIPLKLAAWCFGWRISQTNADRSEEKTGRYAIRDMMIGTAMLAVTLAIGRALVPGDFPPWSAILSESGLDQPQLVIVLSVFSVVSLIVKLPCIWIALATPSEKLLSRSMVWIFLSGVLGLLEYLIFCSVLGSPGGEWLEVVFGLVIGHMAMAVLMLAVLWVLRWFGYSISRKGKTSANPAVQA